MTGPTEVLRAECRTFTAFLMGRASNEYVSDKYVKAHQDPVYSPGTRFETWLVSVARRGPWWALPADCFARIFEPRSLLRKKLVLLLAILETSPPFYRQLDHADAVPTLVLRTTARTLLFVVALALGVILFLPPRLLMRGSGREG